LSRSARSPGWVGCQPRISQVNVFEAGMSSVLAIAFHRGAVWNPALDDPGNRVLNSGNLRPAETGESEAGLDAVEAATTRTIASDARAQRAHTRCQAPALYFLKVYKSRCTNRRGPGVSTETPVALPYLGLRSASDG
jgi:hypothetical protein